MLAAVVAVAAAAATYTNTETVAAVEEKDGALWVTTTGGRERYDLATLARTEVAHVGQPAAAPLAVAPRYQGARETVRVATSVGTIVGTAGNGVWLDGPAPRRLTPTGQICGNHVVAITTWKQHTWVATFDRGVCWLDGDRWVTPTTDFRMANDLIVTPRGLVVAASEGLYVSKDGVHFARWKGIIDDGFNDLALVGNELYATMPGALWRLPVGKGARRARTRWKLGGAKALQAVAADRAGLWVTSEDRGTLQPIGDDDVAVHDRVSGLPTSWHIDVAIVGGQPWVATLRHGLVRRGADGGWTQVAGLETAWLLFVGADRAGTGAWVGAQGGVFHVAADGRVASPPVALPDPNVHVVAELADALWIGTEGGLVRATP
jgi:ligand-binding sensor domain-containing protein